MCFASRMKFAFHYSYFVYYYHYSINTLNYSYLWCFELLGFCLVSVCIFDLCYISDYPSWRGCFFIYFQNCWPLQMNWNWTQFPWSIWNSIKNHIGFNCLLCIVRFSKWSVWYSAVPVGYVSSTFFPCIRTIIALLR